MDHDSRKRWVVYTVVIVAVVVLGAIMISAYRGATVNAEATQKAQQVATAITNAGYTAPDTEAIARVLGDDGGAVCQDPGNALRQAAWNAMIANGATGPGARPVIGDHVLVRAEGLIIGVYCPDRLPAYNDLVKKLKLAEVAVVRAS
jgi:hypothetical protein